MPLVSWLYGLKVAILMTTPLVSNPRISHKIAAIEDCLKTCYQIDDQTLAPIVLRFGALIDNEENRAVIDDFIEKSNHLSIDFTHEASTLNISDEDPLFQAPEWHEVLFESSHVRVLWGQSLPGDQEPAHTHQWKSIMVITQPGEFEIKNQEGKEKGVWPIGVYELPAETFPSSYTNIGTTQFQALRFEIKES